MNVGNDDAFVLLCGQESLDDTGEAYPEGTIISRPNQASRMFNVRLSEEQFAAIQEIAESQHLPMSTIARAWLPDRLDKERRAS